MTPFERINQPLAPTIKAVIVVGCLMLLAVALAVVKIEDPEGKAEDDLAKAYRLEAVSVCKDVVRRGAKHPSRASFPFFDIGWSQSPTDPTHVVVVGGVELMNGFGAMIPHRYRCEFKAGKMTDVKLERG